MNFKRSRRTRFGKIAFIAVLIVMTATMGWAGIPWNLKQLSVPPRVDPAPGFSEPGVRAMFFDGVPWQGKPTRVFAWYGVPAHSDGQRLPAIVLVHGGYGTAFAEWVRRWNARGYAAIAIDTNGCVPIPDNTPKTWKRDTEGGPPGWGGFDQLALPVKDQWAYHAVADIVLANSLLRSFPEIDSARIGVTGGSWGGYLTLLAAAIDKRFRFAVPVYGCGFLEDASNFQEEFKRLGPAKAHEWLSRWDPSVYLPRARMPILWVDGTNDTHFPLNSLRESYLAPHGPRILCIRVRMPHNQEATETAEEIGAFADGIVKSGTPLLIVGSSVNTGQAASVSYTSSVPVIRAELNYTTDSNGWSDRKWNTVPAEVVIDKRKVEATLPKGCTVYYFNLIDQRGLIVSSDLHMQ